MAEASCCPDFGPSWGQWQPCWVLRVQSGEMAPGSIGWETGARHQKGETGGPHMARMGQHPRYPQSGSGLGFPGGLGGNAEPTTLASHDQHTLCAECSMDGGPVLTLHVAPLYYFLPTHEETEAQRVPVTQLLSSRGRIRTLASLKCYCVQHGLLGDLASPCSPVPLFQGEEGQTENRGPLLADTLECPT